MALAEAGRRVTLIEKRPQLGGRAHSFVDAKTGDEVDNGQHIILGCCTNTIDFIERLGQADSIVWTKVFHYLLPGGERHDFRLRNLPAPLHALPALLGFGALGWVDKVSIIRAFLQLTRWSRVSGALHQGETMLQWLKRHRQTERAIKRFWQPILVGAVNEELEFAAVGPCLKVFLEGFLPHPQAPRFGVPKDGLRRVIAEPALAKLRELGVDVRLRHGVRRFERGNAQIKGGIERLYLDNGEVLKVDGVTFALPAPALSKIQRDSEDHLIEPASPEHLAFSPIAGVHLWYDRIVTDLEHGSLLESPMHWFFARTTASKNEGQRISFVISASRHLEDLSSDAAAELADAEFKRYLPQAQAAKLLHQVVVREKRATFSATPAFEVERPPAATSCPNAVLAGDWTRNDWPSTLEGSIRSGRIAADLRLADGRSRVTPDLKVGWLARPYARK